MLSCREVTRLVAGEERRGLRASLELRLHLFLCRHCRRYVGELRAIGAAARSLIRRDADAERLAAVERRVMDRIPEQSSPQRRPGA
ncbi:MAG: anti-sigma factor [Gemmatimonadales bacterium]